MALFRNPKSKLVLYTSNTKSDGSHPVYLRLNYKGKRKYFSTHVDGRLEKWNPVKQRFKNCRPKCKGNTCPICQKNAELDRFFSGYHATLEKLRKQYEEFDWRGFKILMFDDDPYEPGSALSLINQKITELNRGIDNQTSGIGTRDSYITTRNNLELFLISNGYDLDLPIKSLGVDLLRKFEAYLRSSNRMVYVKMMKTRKYVKRPAKRGMGSTSVGITMRNIRTLWNIAISNNPSLQNYYPFGEGKYKIKSGKPRQEKSRHLTIDEIKKLIAYRKKIINIDVHENLLLWLAMFYGNGMNMADLCRLEWGKQAVETDKGFKITFQRVKNRNKDDQPSGTIEDDNLNRIISWFQQKYNIAGYPYVFPVLLTSYLSHHGSLTEEQIKHAYRSRNRKIVKDIRWLCKEAGIERAELIDVYSARHSFACLEYDLTKDLYRVQTKLLHTSIKTTEKYLKSLKVDIQKMPNQTSEAIPFV